VSAPSDGGCETKNVCGIERTYLLNVQDRVCMLREDYQSEGVVRGFGSDCLFVEIRPIAKSLILMR
jgi:hypothetical protein